MTADSDLTRLRDASRSLAVHPAGAGHFSALELLDRSPGGVVVLSRSFTVLYSNRAARRAVGRAIPAGHDIFALFTDLRGSGFESALTAALSGSVPVTLERFQYPGTGRFFRIWIGPLSDAVAVIFRDVTEVAQRERQQRFVARLGMSALTLQGTDADAVVAGAVEEARELLGADYCGYFSVSEARARLTAGSGWEDGWVGTHVEELEEGSHLSSVIRTGEVMSMLSTRDAADGTPGSSSPLLAAHDVSCGVSAAVFSADGVQGILTAYCRKARHFAQHDLDFLQTVANIVAGVGERERVAASLAESENRLRQARKMEAVGRVAGGVAHDFNNLLTLIHSYSEMVMAELQDDEELRSDVEQIRDASQKAAALTRQLLAFSRRQVLRPRELNLNDVIDGMRKMLPRVLTADIAIEFILEPHLFPVHADPGQVEQVVANLVLNARDAMPQGGQLIVTTRNVEAASEGAGWADRPAAGEWVELAITDTGIGMDGDTVEKIFDPFFSTKGVGEGSGLGLSTVYGIVSQSGGHISVDSEPGKGTTMRIFLPRYLSESGGPALSVATTDPVGAKDPAGRAVLLVEDDPGVRGVVSRILKGGGYAVLEAGDGEEALQLLDARGSEVDMILTDIMMPRMNGRDLARALRGRGDTRRVLFMSGYSEERIVTEELVGESGAFLQKPFTAEELLLAVRDTLTE